MNPDHDRPIPPTTRRTWLVLTGRGIMLLVVGLLLGLHGAMREIRVELWVASMLLAEVTVAALYGLWLTRGLTARVAFPRTAHSRTRRVIPFQLVSDSGLPAPRFRIFLQVEEVLHLVTEVDGGILGRGEIPFDLEACFMYRGRFTAGRLEARADLMGVAEACTCFEFVIDVTVYPTVRALERAPVPAGSPRSITGDHVLDLPGQEVEVIGLREYAPGDSPRAVDWRAYARSGKLHVKERPRLSEADVALAVDLSPTEDEEASSGSEDLITLAASFSEHFLRRQQRCRLFLAGERSLAIPFGNGALHRARLLTALTFARPGEERALAALLREHRPTLASSAMLIVLASRAPSPALEAELVELVGTGVEVRACTIASGSGEGDAPSPPAGAAGARRKASLRRLVLDPHQEWSRLVGRIA